ncbi:MAG: dihydrofolate reductase [Nanoarchaeota archaeon]|nr:dihydrofolate reductase [Nanoarchaeota archaeon]
MIELTGIVAMGKNNEIGVGLLMPWWLEEYASQQRYKDLRTDDLGRFKEITMGHHVLMGRLTYESFPKFARPLPGRINHVLSTDMSQSKKLSLDFEDEQKAKILRIHSSFESLEGAIIGLDHAYVIGGGQVYAHFISDKKEGLKMNRILVTRINDDFPMADVFFPPLEANGFEKDDSLTLHPANPENKGFYSFDTYVRR